MLLSRFLRYCTRGKPKRADSYIIKMYTTLLICFMQLSAVNSDSVHMKLPDINEAVIDQLEHLKYTHVKEICISRDSICQGKDTNICAMRYENGSIVYKDFINTCYMFLTNMCDNPGDEYYIVSSGSCKQYINARRSIQSTYTNPQEMVTTTPNKVTSILRDKIKTTFSTLYDIDTAFDFHLCPHSCPDTYSPVCVSANRGFGKYFKFFTFVNHCSGDLYYCKNWQEFAPPDDEDERVNISPLSWSFCGASRYLQFARFAEVTSSMGHYGWLAGDYRYSHIMEPHQKMPGYG